MTGGTSGIGESLVRTLTAAHADVLFTGRDDARGRALATATGAAFLRADFSKLDEVRDLARHVAKSTDRLDVLVNNAGAYLSKRVITPEGVEETFVVNHLASFVLTLRLLPLLEKSAPARVITTSSHMHGRGHLDLDDLAHDAPFKGGVNAYSRSKLANVLFARALARRLDAARITSNAVHPGFVSTRIGGSNRGVIATAWNLFKRFGIRPDEGARTLVWAVTAPELAGVSGKYFAKEAKSPSSRVSRDEAFGEALWAVSEKITGESFDSPLVAEQKK